MASFAFKGELLQIVSIKKLLFRSMVWTALISVVLLYAAWIFNEHLMFVRDYQADLPEVLADPGMIEHAVVNLVLNCLHATSLTPAPEIRIRVNASGDHVWLAIRDNGCGIPKEHIGRVFEPSFTLKGRLDKNGDYHQNIKGTGYGLANVKKYVEQHHGRIEVESEPGSGTVFRIGLPITRKELTPVEAQSLADDQIVQNRHILIVEDEKDISDVQSNILTAPPCRHTVDAVHSAKEALGLIRRNLYDCISLDYVLPGNISGMDIYQEIRQSSPETPVLFISGNIEFLESIKILKAHDPNLDHLSKPCTSVEYIAHINRLLNGKHGDGYKS